MTTVSCPPPRHSVEVIALPASPGKEIHLVINGLNSSKLDGAAALLARFHERLRPAKPVPSPRARRAESRSTGPWQGGTSRQTVANSLASLGFPCVVAKHR
jgi:hypothetical protein